MPQESTSEEVPHAKTQQSVCHGKRVRMHRNKSRAIKQIHTHIDVRTNDATKNHRDRGDRFFSQAVEPNQGGVTG